MQKKKERRKKKKAKRNISILITIGLHVLAYRQIRTRTRSDRVVLLYIKRQGVSSDPYSFLLDSSFGPVNGL